MNLSKRVEKLEGRLGIGAEKSVILLNPPPPVINPGAPCLLERFPRRDGETDVEYLARYNGRPWRHVIADYGNIKFGWPVRVDEPAEMDAAQ